MYARELNLQADASERQSTQRWIGVAALAVLGIAWLVGWHWATTEKLANIWWNIGTYAHGMVVAPISAWLVWRLRHEFALLVPQPEWRVLPLLVMMLGATALGEIAQINALAHAGMIGALILFFWLIAGTPFARRFAFPLAFLLFAVPIGDFMLPTMMEWTADFTVGALRLTGIPVHREGQRFTLPTGSWAVVEACSGIRYLIASVMVGVLFAYLNYRSTLRRLVFVAAAIVVPLIANWVRAYIVVMLGHLSNNRIATGIDHLVYGWVFFGIVMFLLFWVGSHWQQVAAVESAAAPALRRAQIGIAGPGKPIWPAALAFMGLVAVFWPGWVLLNNQPGPLPNWAALTGPAGWAAAADGPRDFTPAWKGADSSYAASFVSGARRVSVRVAYYAAQHADNKAISSSNPLLTFDDADWHTVGHGKSPAALPNGVSMNTARLNSALSDVDRVRAAVWHAYYVGGRWTDSATRAKFWETIDLLRGRGTRIALVAFTALDDGSVTAAEKLEQFVPQFAIGLDRVLGTTEK
ncbi:MAG: exosortase A [Rhodocyclaceae bacterium]|nr:exosortase A [Rhodocyclaceae bacterium]MBX3667644.1 exosortase A [Rhodocyclaceae bacterium]